MTISHWKPRAGLLALVATAVLALAATAGAAVGSSGAAKVAKDQFV